MKNFFITILITFIFFDSSLTSGEPLVGGWMPIPNVTDPTVVDIGKFAVVEHNKENHVSLKFEKVVKGQSQVVAGMNYNLTIMATNGDIANNYMAIVWDKPWEKFRKLMSFKGPI